MTRLRESEGPVTPIEAEAIELLRASAGHQPPAGQKQRVRARLLQHRVNRRGTILRPAVVVMVVVLFGAVASAAAGRHWIAHTIHTLVATPEGPTNVSPPLARTTRTTRVHRADMNVAPMAGQTPSAAPDDSSAASEANGVAPGVEMDAAAAAPSHAIAKLVPGFTSELSDRPKQVATFTHGGRRHHQKSTPSASAAKAVVATGPAPARGDRLGEDTGLVFDAMRLMRQDRRPARAAELLDEYLRRHPGGALAEEATALSIEAAMARHDPRARNLIDVYLGRYPGGHFRATVEDARARLAP